MNRTEKLKAASLIIPIVAGNIFTTFKNMMVTGTSIFNVDEPIGWYFEDFSEVKEQIEQFVQESFKEAQTYVSINYCDSIKDIIVNNFKLEE